MRLDFWESTWIAQYFAPAQGVELGPARGPRLSDRCEILMQGRVYCADLGLMLGIPRIGWAEVIRSNQDIGSALERTISELPENFMQGTLKGGYFGGGVGILKKVFTGGAIRQPLHRRGTDSSHGGQNYLKPLCEVFESSLIA